MLYKTIFERVKDGDTISILTNLISDRFALDDPGYVSFVQDKLATRKEIEKLYKNFNFIGQSFRVFLHEIVLEMKGNKLKERQYFLNNQKETIADIKKRINDCYACHLNIEKELTNYFWKHDKIFKSMGFDRYFLKFKFESLYELKNGIDSIDMYLRLDDDLKKIFIDEVKDDWGDKINGFQDPAIYLNGKCIFASISHEDAYFWHIKE